MINNWHHKGLFVFSDPGGAKPILAMAQARSATEPYIVISDRKYAFYSDFGVEVNAYSENDETLLLARYKPAFVCAGTSYTSRIELKFIQEARRLSIPTYSFVDHWTSLKERFWMDGSYMYPDHIGFPDKRALDLALEQGIPASLLEICPNPYYDFLRKWRPSMSKREAFNSLGLDSEKMVLLYCPDPLSNVGGFAKFGMDEVTGLRMITAALEKREDKHRYQILIQPHPNQNIKVFDEDIARVNGFQVTVNTGDLDVNLLIFHSNLILGFFSNILLEAELLGKPVGRLLGDLKTPDPFEHNRPGRLIYSEEDLQNLLSGIQN